VNAIDGLTASSRTPMTELLPVFEAAEDPNDVGELFDLYMGMIESITPQISAMRGSAKRWIAASKRRELSAEQILGFESTPFLVKRIYDFFFRSDLYGFWKNSDPIVLSSGSFHGDSFGIPEALSNCIEYALSKKWYGYCDSLGLTSTRSALASLESIRLGRPCGPDEVVVTMGATLALSSIADYISSAFRDGSDYALTCTPAYPPLVAAVSSRMRLEMVPATTEGAEVEIGELLDRARSNPPKIVMLQTVVNPWGLRVRRDQIEELIRIVGSNGFVILDECHETFGPDASAVVPGAHENVIRLRSLSKRWGVPGLRTGWVVCSAEFAKDYYSHISMTYSSPPSVFSLFLEMFAALEAAMVTGSRDLGMLSDIISSQYDMSLPLLRRALDDYLDVADRFKAQVIGRRTEASERLGAAGCEVIVPDYSINLLAKIGELRGYETYRRLIQETGVSLYPGIMSYSSGPGVMRVSPCIPEGDLEKGLTRIESWIATGGITS
jgi:aspartate/methionine/tyrosine aminotransferase